MKKEGTALVTCCNQKSASWMFRIVSCYAEQILQWHEVNYLNTVLSSSLAELKGNGDKIRNLSYINICVNTNKRTAEMED